MKLLSYISELLAYENKKEFFQDLIRPFVGIGNILLGIIITFIGIFPLFIRDTKLFSAGILALGKGLFQVAMAPLSWSLQPLLKGIATLIPRRKIDPVMVKTRKEFSDFATNNFSCFEEGTYFLVSMKMDRMWNDDTVAIYPGAGSKFRAGVTIPDQYRDPLDPQKIHPDLDIQIRIKAHRVFHEQILGHRINIAQTIMANESAVFFETRGGGAILKEGQLIPHYKSGVLNGKWSIPFIGQHLGYGDLRKQDRSRFAAALGRLTNLSSNTQNNDSHHVSSSAQAALSEATPSSYSGMPGVVVVDREITEQIEQPNNRSKSRYSFQK